MKFCRSLFLLPFVLIRVWAAPVEGVVMPEKVFPQLDVILKSAVEQSPAMLNRTLDLEIAEAARVQARSNLLPSLTAGYSFYKSQDKTEYLYSNPGSNNSINSYLVTKTPYNVILSQPVYHWNEKRNLDRIGAIQLQIAKGQYREGYRLLAQEVRSTYMHLIVQKLVTKRTKFNLQFTNTQLKEQEERYVKKEVSDAQIFSSRLAAEQAQIASDRSDFDYSSALQSFVRLTGVSSFTDDSVPDEVPTSTYDPAVFDRMLAEFLAQKDPPTNEAVVLKRQIDVENLNYANARTRLRPKVNATVGLTKDQQNNLYGQGLDYSVASFYGGLSLSWTIFDGFYSKSVVRSTLASRRKLENTYRQTTERLAQDAQTQVKLINFNARNMSVYDRLLVSSAGYLRTVRDDFSRGTRSEAEVSQNQLNLFDAQINASNVRCDYFLRVGDFLGTITEDPVLANLTEK